MSAPWIVAFVVQTVLLVGLMLIVAGLLKRTASALEEAAERLRTGMITIQDFGGLLPGAKVGDFSLTDWESRPLRRDDLVAEPAVFLFVEEGCDPCELLVEEMEGRIETILGVPFYVVIDEIPGEEVKRPYSDMAPLLQHGRAASHAFQNSTAPQAFAVAAGGTVVAKTIPRSLGDLEDLAREARKGGGVGGEPQAEVHVGS